MSQNKKEEEFKRRLRQVAQSVIEIAKEEEINKKYNQNKTEEKGENEK